MTGACELTQSLSGRWYGSYGSAPCPVCQPERRRDQNALTLRDGVSGLLAHCKKLGCSFQDILRAANVAPGAFLPPDPYEIARRAATHRADIEKRDRQARALWANTLPITGTLAETYLRGRGITCDLPDTLRFHPACWHGASATRHPALVALVEGGDGFAVHRTYLRLDGAAKAALDPVKAMLGPVSGGAVRLCEGPGNLAIAEGIETALSLASGLMRRPATVWAALSTSGMRELILPPEPGHLLIAPDGDSPGEAAAHALGERAYALGWCVSLLPAPKGRDWNDLLIMKRGKG